MAKIRHSIVLDLSGNIETQLNKAVKAFDKLGSAAQRASKGVSGATTAVGGGSAGGGGAAESGADHPASDGSRAEQARRRQSLRTMQADAASGLMTLQVAGMAARAATGVMTGGSVTQAMASGVTAAGGIISANARTGKGRALGMSVGIIGGVAGTILQKGDEGFALAERLRTIQSATGQFSGTSIESLMAQSSAVSRTTGMMPSDVRDIQESVARSSGGVATNEELSTVARARRAFNVGSGAESIIGTGKRFGRTNAGGDITAILAQAVEKGVNRGLINEHLETIAELQQQTVTQTGRMASATEIARGVTSFAQLGVGLQGDAGKTLAQSADAAIKGASKNGGMIMAALMSEGVVGADGKRKKLSYYEAREQAEKGLTGTSLEAVTRYVKKIGADPNVSAMLFENLFGTTFTQGKNLTGLLKTGVAGGASDRALQVLKTIEAAEGETEATRMAKVKAGKAGLGEGAAIFGAKVETKVLGAVNQPTAEAEGHTDSNGVFHSVQPSEFTPNIPASGVTGTATVNITKDNKPQGAVVAPVRFTSSTPIPVRR